MVSTYLVAIFVSSNVSPKTRWQTTETQGCQVLSYLRASVPHSGQRLKFFLNSLLAAGTTSISIKDAEYPLQLHVHRVLLNEVVTPCSAHAKNRDRSPKSGNSRAVNNSFMQTYLWKSSHWSAALFGCQPCCQTRLICKRIRSKVLHCHIYLMPHRQTHTYIPRHILHANYP